MLRGHPTEALSTSYTSTRCCEQYRRKYIIREERHREKKNLTQCFLKISSGNCRWTDRGEINKCGGKNGKDECRYANKGCYKIYSARCIKVARGRLGELWNSKSEWRVWGGFFRFFIPLSIVVIQRWGFFELLSVSAIREGQVSCAVLRYLEVHVCTWYKWDVVVVCYKGFAFYVVVKNSWILLDIYYEKQRENMLFIECVYCMRSCKMMAKCHVNRIYKIII